MPDLSKIALYDEGTQTTTEYDICDDIARTTVTVVQEQVSDVETDIAGVKTQYGSKFRQTASEIETLTTRTDTTALTVSNHETRIAQNASDILLKANNTYTDTVTGETRTLAAQLDINAQQISSKVGNGEIISKINQSAEAVTIDAAKINLNGVVTANNNFKINTDGSMETIAGKIGGFNIGSTKLESPNGITINSVASSSGDYLLVTSSSGTSRVGAGTMRVEGTDGWLTRNDGGNLTIQKGTSDANSITLNSNDTRQVIGLGNETNYIDAITNSTSSTFQVVGTNAGIGLGAEAEANKVRIGKPMQFTDDALNDVTTSGWRNIPILYGNQVRIAPSTTLAVSVDSVGTTSTEGRTVLKIGNDKGTGVADNSYGTLRMYDHTGKYWNIQGNGTLTTNRNLYIPNNGASYFVTETQENGPKNGSWVGVPRIASDGGMEIGHYIDFHTAGTSTDYTQRVSADSNYLYTYGSVYVGDAFKCKRYQPIAVGSGSGASASTWYKAVTITLSDGATYLNQSCSFMVSMRNSAWVITIGFTGASTRTAITYSLEQCSKKIIHGTSSTSTKIHESSDGVFDVWVKGGGAYQEPSVFPVIAGNYFWYRASVTYPMTTSTTEPSGEWINGGGNITLWTNSSPTSDFTAQTISTSLAMDSFSAIEILFKVNSDTMKTYRMPIQQGGVYIDYSNNYQLIDGQYSGYYRFRRFKIATSSTITFEGAYYYSSYTSTTKTASNGSFIPYKVIGIV